MNRIPLVDPAAADPKAQELLDAAKKKMGIVPNILKGLAQSPAALDAYLSLSGALGGAALGPKIREQIALATAGANGCDYCAAAHTAIGKSLGLDADELGRNLAGGSDDAKTAAALTFTNAVIESRGKVSDDELQTVRDAGFTDGEIVEIVAAIALNTYTNYFNRLADTEIDFPRVALATA